jgi:hypothetical protein
MKGWAAGDSEVEHGPWGGETGEAREVAAGVPTETRAGEVGALLGMRVERGAIFFIKILII